MTKAARSLIGPALLAMACSVASGCTREANRADYVSARVRAHCSDPDPDTRRACRLAVIRHYGDTSLEEFQRTEEKPRLRSIWCHFQGNCIPSLKNVGAEGSPDTKPAPVSASPSAVAVRQS